MVCVELRKVLSMTKLQIGIVGYGNIGRGVEKALLDCPDMALACVVTRRAPDTLKIQTPGVAVLGIDEALARDDIDVMVLCGGSATDLAVQGPQFAARFNTVDSYDTHAKIPEYFAAMNRAAVSTTAMISCGWDPGLFSLMRLLGGAFLPVGQDTTFWGPGVSQGHSDAIRRIDGVADATQYTVPIDGALDAVRNGGGEGLTTRQKHRRVCYVVLRPNADEGAVRQAIVSMPNYFADYDTEVYFISQDELNREHKQMPHGGFVFRNGQTGEHKQGMEFSLRLASNPEFTGSVMVACARATARLAREGRHGAVTVLDVPPAYYSPISEERLRATLL